MSCEFALYKGENILCIGTLEEIARETNVSLGTIKYYRTKAYKRKLEKRKNSTNALILVELEDD